MNTASKSLAVYLCTYLVLISIHSVMGSNVSSSMGTIEIQLKEGTPEAPHYAIISVSAQETAIFRGYIESVVENNITLEKLIDPTNPALEKNPLSGGVLGTVQAKATATLDANGSLNSIIVTKRGDRYNGKPLVFIDPPNDVNGSYSEIRGAIAEAEWNASSGKIDEVNLIDRGIGYLNPPKLSIDGGPCFLRLVESDSNYSGIFFKIIGNTDDSLEVNASMVDSLEAILKTGDLVEVVPAFTISSLLGDSSTPLQADENASLADWVFLLEKQSLQTGNASDYISIFNDGASWKSVQDPTEDFSEQAIFPDDAMIIARRNDSNLSLFLSGVAQLSSTYWELPETGKAKLVGNPYSTEVMLSDLIDNQAITENNSTDFADCWLAHANPELADNIQILDSSQWNTYWHDGSNLYVTEIAKISARAGSGIGGSLTSYDFSMSSGIIENASNEINNKVTITSTSHGLKAGFFVTIKGAIGRKTNDLKNQVNSSSEEVPDGQGLMVHSTINGYWEITSTTPDTFQIESVYPNSDFFSDGNATWETGVQGSGYDNNVSLSIIGGGGRGARAMGIVKDGRIETISLISGGLLYTSPPTIVVHNGGWKNIISGNAPINDVRIPASSGILLIRNHPFGQNCTIPVGKLINF